MSRDDYSLGVALEIMAIGLSEQGENSNIVLSLFRRAARVAPSNPRIAANLAAFERYAQSRSSPAEWETEEIRAEYESRERWRMQKKEQVLI